MNPPAQMKEKHLQRRLAATKARVRYHSRIGYGASRTKKDSGEALSLAKADVQQLTHFLESARAALKKLKG